MTQTPTRTGRRLMPWWFARIPDAARTWRGQMPRRNVEMRVAVLMEIGAPVAVSVVALPLVILSVASPLTVLSVIAPLAVLLPVGLIFVRVGHGGCPTRNQEHQRHKGTQQYRKLSLHCPLLA
jgi:hypothetical protein